MARRPKLIAKRQKITRITKSEQYLINHKYMGDEPVYTGPLTESDILKSLNWYNGMCTVHDARDYLKTYLKNLNRTEDAKKLARISDSWVPTTGAWLARLCSQGYKLPEGARARLEGYITGALRKAPSEAPEAVDKAPKTSIQDRMRERCHDIIGEIEAEVDKADPEFSLYEWLKANEIPPSYCSNIALRYAEWCIELCDALEGKDAQLKEAYRHMTKKQLKERIAFLDRLMDDCDRYSEVAKKTRQPRKPRTVSVDKILKNLKYQKEDSTFKIASINPTKILGAQELWVFNTKYKYITVFRALDRAGLSVHRSSIANYDEKTSCTKRTGKKPEQYVQKILTGGKLVLRKVMDELSGDCTLAHRINENTVLLKVVT